MVCSATDRVAAFSSPTACPVLPLSNGEYDITGDHQRRSPCKRSYSAATTLTLVAHIVSVASLHRPSSGLQRETPIHTPLTATVRTTSRMRRTCREPPLAAHHQHDARPQRPAPRRRGQFSVP
ncbi:hypothetical protein B0H16DRAFT_1900594 [Mycena metata]|uniref:Uncharacterized protein n=1 Tax=Mycena metata TaxID=1033252 RepID=A0AAD7H3L9_9AGAR|nr:hypothetical protein B0H16DRAFT_1900594 [Mycena metata]